MASIRNINDVQQIERNQYLVEWQDESDDWHSANFSHESDAIEFKELLEEQRQWEEE